MDSSRGPPTIGIRLFKPAWQEPQASLPLTKCWCSSEIISRGLQAAIDQAKCRPRPWRFVDRLREGALHVTRGGAELNVDCVLLGRAAIEGLTGNVKLRQSGLWGFTQKQLDYASRTSASSPCSSRTSGTCPNLHAAQGTIVDYVIVNVDSMRSTTGQS